MNIAVVCLFVERGGYVSPLTVRALRPMCLEGCVSPLTQSVLCALEGPLPLFSP